MHLSCVVDGPCPDPRGAFSGPSTRTLHLTQHSSQGAPIQTRSSILLISPGPETAHIPAARGHGTLGFRLRRSCGLWEPLNTHHRHQSATLGLTVTQTGAGHGSSGYPGGCRVVVWGLQGCRAASACLSGSPGTRLTVLEGTGHSWGMSSPFEAWLPECCSLSLGFHLVVPELPTGPVQSPRFSSQELNHAQKGWGAAACP